MSNVFRNFPSVNELLDSPALKQLMHKLNPNAVVTGVRQFLDGVRADMQTAVQSTVIPTPAELAQRIADWISSPGRNAFRPVVNATGVCLPTAGRVPLPEEAVEAIRQSAAGYTNLLPISGSQVSATGLVQSLLTKLTGAEAALVVQREAAGLWLTLAALAPGKEVLLSRGSVIDLEGSRPLTELAPSSGATLREVGATNRTRIEDYERAINERTAAILHVQAADYAVAGRMEQPTPAELVALARKRNLPLVHVLGDGSLIAVGKYGLKGEPVVAESIQVGADLVLFRGDGLIGGPPCGLIVGKSGIVKQLTAHPLAFGLQADDLSLAALAATLHLYTITDAAERSIPPLALLAVPLDNLKNRAERLAPQLAAIPRVAAAAAIQEVTWLRGHSVPGQEIATWCVALTPARGSADELAGAFARSEPSIVGRVLNGRLLIDLRSVFARQDMEISAAAAAMSQLAPTPEPSTPPPPA